MCQITFWVFQILFFPHQHLFIRDVIKSLFVHFILYHILCFLEKVQYKLKFFLPKELMKSECLVSTALFPCHTN